MAEVEVIGAEMANGRVSGLRVRFKHTAERRIDRDTALAWLGEGHCLLAYAGPSHHGVRGRALARVEADGAWYLRTDTSIVAIDELVFPAAEGH